MLTTSCCKVYILSSLLLYSLMLTSPNNQFYNYSRRDIYLGITKRPLLKTATIEAIKRQGTGSGGSRLTTGNSLLHEELEKTIGTGQCDNSYANSFNEPIRISTGFRYYLRDNKKVNREMP